MEQAEVVLIDVVVVIEVGIIATGGGGGGGGLVGNNLGTENERGYYSFVA
ncbi:unnamed protein product [marine sediment metagenome]|uniref:Uncharacterized protein n=1 Tax=marine sediment metagenome TaxID=412755 RepID=X1VXC2_9ZZZZ